MTVAEFIEWLKTQDQRAEVRVMKITYGGVVKEVPFDPEDEKLWCYLNWRPSFDESELTLGEDNT